MFRKVQSRAVSRAVFGLICALIFLTGIGNLLRHRLDYLNYKGFAVFSPFAILVGGLGLAVAISKPQLFIKSDEKHETSSISPTHGRRKRR